MKKPIDTFEPIHNWFGLSYASYLVMPRVVLQSLPSKLQARIVNCLNEANDLIDWMPEGKTYYVQLRDDRTGRYTKDNLCDYQRGRRRLLLK
jgi:hypothetical protein